MRALSTMPNRARSPQIPRPSRRGPTPLSRGLASAARRGLRAHPSNAADFGERWLTKRELADHLRVTPRWIELQQHLGLPVLRLGTVNRYRLSEVEAWFRRQYESTATGRSA